MQEMKSNPIESIIETLFESSDPWGLMKVLKSKREFKKEKIKRTRMPEETRQFIEKNVDKPYSWLIKNGLDRRMLRETVDAYKRDIKRRERAENDQNGRRRDVSDSGNSESVTGYGQASRRKSKESSSRLRVATTYSCKSRRRLRERRVSPEGDSQRAGPNSVPVGRLLAI